MCTSFERKEANRMYWIVKGHLIPTSWSDKEVVGIYHSYFKRLWGNNENYVHESGFSQAWAIREAEMFDQDIKKVAILGGHYD
jgi:hypothetical protein